MDYITKANAVLPEGWEVYSTGGGCYSASKTLDGVAVEISHEGFANIYKRDEDGTYAETIEEVYDNNYEPNFEVICSVNDHGVFEWHLHGTTFNKEEQAEIRHAVEQFTKVFKSEEAKEMNVKHAVFTIEDGQGFGGITFGDTWNGWAMPYFTKDVADEILKEITRDGKSKAWHDGYSDSYCVFLDGADPADGLEVYGAKTINGVKYYPIGAGSWCWDAEELSQDIVELKQFRESMFDTLQDLWDTLDKGDYDHKFDLVIEWNGKRIELPMHADLYSRFEAFMDETIEEAQE